MLKDKLLDLYIKQKKSAREISILLNCSQNKINYWLKKFKIQKRSISDAIYISKNPKGDPFEFVGPKTKDEFFFFGLCIGLYWGEGTKADRYAVRLGNSDPKMISIFISFLCNFFKIKKNKIRFGLHLHTKDDLEKTIKFWIKHLKIKRSQFYKPYIIKHKVGTYNRKTENGVLTLYFSNKKMRDLLVKEIEKIPTRM